MDALAPSIATLATLRAIARAGFSYAAAKELCSDAGWALVDDEPDLGYVRWRMRPSADADETLFSVLIAEGASQPWAMLPLFYFEDYETERESFDEAFRSILAQLVAHLGPAQKLGEYRYPHEAAWQFSFAAWSLPDATLVLMQDEYDIQFGMDVTLWVQPPGVALAPVKHG